jgi:hypothetical protein
MVGKSVVTNMPKGLHLKKSLIMWSQSHHITTKGYDHLATKNMRFYVIFTYALAKNLCVEWSKREELIRSVSIINFMSI